MYPVRPSTRPEAGGRGNLCRQQAAASFQPVEHFTETHQLVLDGTSACGIKCKDLLIRQYQIRNFIYIIKKDNCITCKSDGNATKFNIKQPGTSKTAVEELQPFGSAGRHDSSACRDNMLMCHGAPWWIMAAMVPSEISVQLTEFTGFLSA